MLKSDLTPPRNGLNADPILYGVAACLAELFPPLDSPASRPMRGGQDVDEAGDTPGDSVGERGDPCR